MLRKNFVSPSLALQLPPMLRKFYTESGVIFKREAYVQHTLENIHKGIKGTAQHDLWISELNGEIGVYCAGHLELDPDGETVYTAYQLWIHPSLRNQNIYKKVVKFLTFYAQKHKLKRLYVVSSRLDHIKAYQRGLGYDFKPQQVTFMKEC